MQHDVLFVVTATAGFFYVLLIRFLLWPFLSFSYRFLSQTMTLRTEKMKSKRV